MSVRKQSMARIKLEGKNLEDLDFWTKSDPFLVLSRPARNGSGFTQVRKTETVRNNLNPSWKVLYIPTSELCDDNHNMPLNLEVYDEDRNSRNDFIGSVQLSLGELQRLSESHSPVILKKGPKERGQLLVTECQIEEPSSDLERKGSIGAYPSSRRQSTYSSPGDLATSQVYQQQAVAPQLLGQGQPCHPLHAAPQLLGQGHPHHHPGQYQGGPYGDHNVNSFPPGPPFVFPFNQTGPGPYTPGPYVPFPGTGPYVPTPGYPAPTAFPPTIPEDPSDTRPKSIWL